MHTAIMASFLFLPLMLLSGESHATHHQPCLHHAGKKSVVVHKKSVAGTVASPRASRKRQTQLLSAYHEWKGTRYRLGGTSHTTIDCSSFTRHIYRERFRRLLPRTTAGQLHKGHRVSQDRLKPGDLVFFHTGKRQRHVGVYVGGRQFMHASRRKGVTLSTLDSGYWEKHYLTARRILPPPVD